MLWRVRWYNEAMEKPLRIAIVHDYLREYGGAERVVESLHALFPDAPVYTAFVDPTAMGKHWQRFKDWNIIESSGARLPFMRKLFSPLRLFAAYFFESFDFSGFDVVISSTNMYMAKAVITSPRTLHLCYCHTPPRSLYGYATQTNWKKNPFIRLVGEMINYRLRSIDYLTAQRPDVMIANSKETQSRILKFYKRDAVVVYPPVSLSSSPSKKVIRSYYLYVNRLAFAKNPELVVRMATTHQLPLKIVGTGAMESKLRAIAGPTVEFLGAVNDAALSTLYSEAIAVLYPVKDEDFGIVPVESMMAGTPVIAHNSGGPIETVISNRTGILFEDLSEDGLWKAIEAEKSQTWEYEQIKKHASQFSEERFKKNIEKLIEKNLK